jgi:hypothetical protein
MEQFAGGLMSLAVMGAIFYGLGRAAARATVAPIHAKLDRLIALQEQSLGRHATLVPRPSTDEGARHA